MERSQREIQIMINNLNNCLELINRLIKDQEILGQKDRFLAQKEDIQRALKILQDIFNDENFRSESFFADDREINVEAFNQVSAGLLLIVEGLELSEYTQNDLEVGWPVVETFVLEYIDFLKGSMYGIRG
ncbi:MAG: hypothetical protein HYR81_02855 [Nitrospirae bacterium]|nr:hypothetical protein [Nitrospirota bacterium]